MKILLIGNLYSRPGTSCIFVLKALINLGHEVKVWDPINYEKPPEGIYDIALSWSNKKHDMDLINAKRKILYYLEDAEYAANQSNYPLIEMFEHFKDHDEFYTMNKIPGYEDHWLPMGADPDQFKPMNSNIFEKNVLFLGTFRGKEREEFINEVRNKLKISGFNLKIIGNGWINHEGWLGQALYLNDLNYAINSFKITINKHIGNLSPSQKVHQLICNGSTLFLSDDKEAYKECYPKAPVYKDVNELCNLIYYYFEREEERLKIVNIMREKAIKDYTYEKQLNKIIGNI
ncbi:MAG: hypothetical protein Q7R52_02610 [archaeon]|nr:hypothetical protein [archaeon]